MSFFIPSITSIMIIVTVLLLLALYQRSLKPVKCSGLFIGVACLFSVFGYVPYIVGIQQNYNWLGKAFELIPRTATYFAA